MDCLCFEKEKLRHTPPKMLSVDDVRKMELIFEAEIVLSDKFAAKPPRPLRLGSFRSRSNPIVQFSIFMVEIISLLPVKV
jgi:hypothetical protein